MDKKQQLLLEKQLRKCRKELTKLVSMEGFDEIDVPANNQGFRKIGDKLGELIKMMYGNRL